MTGEPLPRRSASGRYLKDRLATLTITAGGVGVLLAVVLIFFYLLYEVIPLFRPAHLSEPESLSWPAGSSPTHYLSLEEQGGVAFSVDATGRAVFIEMNEGDVLLSRDLALGREVTAIAGQGPGSSLIAQAYADGTVELYDYQYRITYDDQTRREVTPVLGRLYSDIELRPAPTGALQRIAVRDSDKALVLAGVDGNGGVAGMRLRKEENFLTGEVTLQRSPLNLPPVSEPVSEIFIESGQRWLFLLTGDGDYSVVDLASTNARGEQRIVDRGRLFDSGGELASSAMLVGGISLLAGSDSGELAQYFMVESENGYRLQRVREFDTGGLVAHRLIPEHRRKGFFAIGKDATLQIFHATANRRLLSTRLGDFEVASGAVSPRADRLAVLDENRRLHVWHVSNEHPDISWSALWEEVWYESYDEPAYVWQSSAASSDFEPKYSFAPLAFGTLKAAFYTMLIAAPLAVCGALYTAYFMAPALRRKIKPVIELMEALPTVILGFLAGLWLAPFVEDNLPGVFSLFIFLPLAVLVFATLWSRLPDRVRLSVPDGWHPVLLIPVILMVGYFIFTTDHLIELWFFQGDMRGWLSNEMGVGYDQRNALIVGIAMGMAVIPTIFSIAEDAVFSVPEHLSNGSLALGATPWQTLMGVILPTASPGIFSALMIGMGRAVGETMIVLMATGNTPIIDANIFEGMRTLSANIAVEVPEAEVDSTHYRLLFLSAFVLFAFTFVINTVAELVRQRLRRKYGSL